MVNVVKIVRASILEADEVAEFLNSLEHEMKRYKYGREDLKPWEVKYKWTSMGPRLIITGRFTSINCICTPKVAGPVIALLREKFGEEMVKADIQLEISEMYL